MVHTEEAMVVVGTAVIQALVSHTEFRQMVHTEEVMVVVGTAVVQALVSHTEFRQIGTHRGSYGGCWDSRGPGISQSY